MGGGTCPGPGCDHRTVQPESGMSEICEALQGFLSSTVEIGRAHV